MRCKLPLGALTVIAAIAALPSTGYGQGIVFPGMGANHRSMAGASTAVGSDAIGALYWNPAAISGLRRSEVVIGGEFLIPDSHLESTIPQGAIGPFPLQTLSGNTRSDSGVVPISGIGLVVQTDDPMFTYGFGLMTLAAGGVNYPGDVNNPILAPVGPFQRFVLGPQEASLTVLSMMPTVSVQLTEQLAFGIGPMIDVSVVSFDPAFFGPPDDSNGDGLFTFPSGAHSRPFWGGGFRAGMTYQVSEQLTAGVAFSSPQWFETWRFNARTETGDPFTFRTQFSLPMILSAGVAYQMSQLQLVGDVRWMDYATTQLLGDFPQDGGAGWKSIWSFAFGARYQLNERLALTGGYLFNENPISSNLSLFNTMLPLINQHTLSVGAYYQATEALGVSLAYVHGFKNSIEGGIFPLIGTSVGMETEYDSFAFGIHIKFGGPCESATPAPCAPAGPPVMTVK